MTMMAIGNNLSSSHLLKQPNLVNKLKLVNICFTEGRLMVSETHKIPILSSDPCLLGRQKNSKGSSLDISPQTVFFFFFFFTIKQQVHSVSFGPIINIVWGTSPWCPCLHSGAQHNMWRSALVRLRAVHMKARVSSDDV